MKTSDRLRHILITEIQNFFPNDLHEAEYFEIVEAVAGMVADVIYMRSDTREQTAVFFTTKLGKRLAILEGKLNRQIPVNGA